VPTQAVCPACGAETAAGAHFCPSCGQALVAACPSCGAETRIGAQFCAACGHRLDRPAPREEERKLVTVLFADLTGSTALGEQLDPERLRLLLAEYFRAMASVIESWGGTVEKFIGDAVMAVFGTPTVHENDAERALRAALDMQMRLGELNPELAERHGVQLAVRISVNTGEVIAGTGGDQFMVTGDVVNVAARLQQTAEPGEIVAGERTYLAARQAFDLEPLEAKALKGKSLPVPAWRVLGRSERAPRRGVPGVSARLVGRERELSLLETLYEAAVEEERPRLVTILGAAGIGKTRLTEEFVALAERVSTPPVVYRGRCLPYGEGITYWALREILWSAAGILLADPGAVAAEKLHTFVRGLLDGSARDASEGERVVHALAKTAGIPLAENPLDRMSPESIGEELGLAWPQLVTALAAERATVVIVEDLHHSEPPLLDMIEHLVSRSTGPVLILATGRPEFAELRPAWSTRPRMSQSGLEPLTENQFSELVQELLPQVGSDLRERVLSTAEGNPYFAEEVVRHLLDKGILARGDRGIVQAEHDVPITIPDSVRALLAARVDALPPEEKLALQDAAVAGRVFWATTLESMRPDGQIRPALRALENKGLVVTRPASSLPGQTELSFHHGLMCEVAYQSIPKDRRARAHAEVGRWIEQLARDRREEYVELIAHHFESAARPDDAELAWPTDATARDEVRAKAIGALLEAGHAARTRFAIDQAIGFGDRALALARTDPERLAGLELKAQAAHAIVRADEAWGYYREALEIAERIGDPGAVYRLRANATLLWSRYGGAFSAEGWKAQALEVLERGLRETSEEDLTFERGALLTGRATARYWEVAPLAYEEARRDAERAVEIATAIGSSTLLTYAVDAVASVTDEKGFCESAQIAERALEVGETMEDRVEAHEMFVTAAISFADAGNFEAAAHAGAEAGRLAAELGPHSGLHAGSAQTAALLPAGRLPELLHATERAAELVTEEGMQTCFHGLRALAGQAVAAYELEGEADANRALEAYDATKPLTQSYWELWTIEILRPLRGLEETRRRLDVVKVGQADTVVALIYRFRTGLQVFALAGEWREFETLADEARSLAQTACAPALGWIADWGESVRLATDGRSEEARAKATTAADSLEACGERYTAARLLADLLPFLDGDPGQRLAEDAVRRLEAIGALTSAAEARKWASRS
jgi:class 3 adenylate cyclase